MPNRILHSGYHNLYFVTNPQLEVRLNKIKRKKKRMIQSSFAVPLCTPYVSQKFLKCRLWNVFWLTMAFSHPFKEDRLVLPLSIPLFQAIDDVMSLGLCMQAPSSTTLKIFQEANHLWGLLCPPVSICSVISLHSGMSRAVHQSGFGRWMSTTDAFQSGLPIPLLTFCSKLIDSVRMMPCVVRLSALEAIQRRAWVTASTSIVERWWCTGS